MMPRLGDKYEDIEIEVISKPMAEYQNDAYFELDLPVAPAVMVGDEIVVEGSNVAQEKVETVICRCLGMPEPEPQKKGILGRLFGK
jgi:predicted HAD superfamily phosphohydrolase YqeG